jgi:hypothetical protein
MKCAVEMGSDSMTYMQSFIKIGSDLQKVLGGGYTHTHTHTHKVIS